MNVYDFDKTIFYPDSSVCFFRYCLLRHPRAVLRTGKEIFRYGLLYVQKTVTTKELKEKLFAFLLYLPEPEKVVRDFWDSHFSGIGRWYLAQKRPDDLIVTASPEFLVGEAAKRLGVSVIGTRMNLHTGQIEGEDCHGQEKPKRFFAVFPEGRIDSFYSDSLSDAPMAALAGQAWLVKKETICPWPN